MNHKVKVLFIITQSELGGAQRWVFDTATNLDKTRYETIVASQPGPLPNKLQLMDIECPLIKNLTRKINPIKDFLGLIEIYRLIRKQNPDILQLCSTKAGILGSIAAFIASRLRGNDKRPLVVYRIGGWSFDDPRPYWQNLIFLWLEKLTSPLKDKIIVNSQKGYNEALQYKICSPKKLCLIYNGIDPTIISASPMQTKNDRVVIGTIANNYPTKGLKYLYQALATIKSKNNPPTKKLESIIIGKNTAIGPKDNPWQYLANQGGVDIFIIPSVKEGLPYVLLEAMARRLPIIATNVGGISEIIKDKKNGLLVPAKNSQKMAKAIESLIQDSNLRKRLGQKAQADVKKYSLKQMMKTMDGLYS